MEKKELVAHIDPELKASQILRRYLDLPKLVDFLRTGQLYLQQASQFPDVLEGTLAEGIRRHWRSTPEIVAAHGDPVTWERKNKDRTYLSCWTFGAKDNMALWKIYGGSSQSVAITTTVNRLMEVAPSWATLGQVGVAKVQYINHEGPLPDGAYGFDSGVFRFKHTAYAFEKEVRIVVTRPSTQKEAPCAIRAPVDVDHFVRSIVVAPEAEDWFYQLVADITHKYNVKSPVRRSKLTTLIAKANAFRK